MTVDSGTRPMVGDIFDDPDDPIVNVTPGWAWTEYGEDRLEVWLRHARWAIGPRAPMPARLAQAVKTYPILAAAKDFLTPNEYRAFVGTFKSAYRKRLKTGDEVPNNDLTRPVGPIMRTQT